MQDRCIIVLGMHRSGTSAAAGMLHILGAELGTDLIPAHADVNPKGFWEHAAVNELDERLLHSLGATWFDVFPIPAEHFRQRPVQALRAQLAELLRREFGGISLWATKDPRICRLLPIWRDVLQELSVQQSYLLVLRHPTEVAGSLSRRDGLAIPYGLLLWLRYVLEGELGTRGAPRTIVTYDELLSDWRTGFARVAQTLGINLNLGDIEVARRADSFLEAKLRHHVAYKGTQNDHLCALAASVYEGVIEGDQERLDALASEVHRATADLAPWLTQTIFMMNKIKSLSVTVTEQISELAAQRCYAAGLESEISRIKNTVSWKLTGPLRATWNSLRRTASK